MIYNVPQFIDIEDKIVGPLTAKQLGWLAAGGVIILVFWATLDNSAFFVATLIIGGLFGALAFYRPYNQPLISFLLSSVHFASRPKIYVWKRHYDEIKTANEASNAPKVDKIIKRKTISSERIKEISRMLDKK